MCKEIEAFNRRYGKREQPTTPPTSTLTTGTDKQPLKKVDMKKLQKPVKDFRVLEAFITN